MPVRIEITAKTFDTRAKVRETKLKKLSVGKKINEVVLVDVYTIDKDFSKKDLHRIASILANPVSQSVSVGKPIYSGTFSYAIEIGFLPGVVDNVAGTAQETIEDLLKRKFYLAERVYTSQITYLKGTLSRIDADTLARSLYNPVIQRVTIKSSREYKTDGGMGILIPKVSLHELKQVDFVDLNVPDEALVTIGKKGVKNKDGTYRGPLALDLLYMKAIQSYFKKQKRNPTDIELESIAQTWSEHCKHTIFADPIDEIKDGLFNTYIKKATEIIRKKKDKKDFCVSVFTDNSGAIEFDEQYLITDKVETHNSPSALDPFGGSITGIVGVNRDSIGFGLGAKPIINRYGFCFADPHDTVPLYKGENFTQKMLEPKRIMLGVIEGVNSGGNCSGIPTPQGFMIFDKRYKGKPLVFVGTVGLIPKKINGKKSYVKKALPGDYIVMVGGRVGQDGIHGATFSSEAMDAGSPATAVQIGDPITQKKLSDAVVKEARNLNLYNSITDNGAGGLSCSVAEMAKEPNGCFVDLEKVPLKYPGLSPWQIWISESQERMTLAVPKNKWKKFEGLMKRRGVEAKIIGTFTKSGRCIVNYHDVTIMDIEMEFLHEGLPKRPMKTKYTQPTFSEPTIVQPKNMTKIMLAMLERLNIASFEFISKQYDHEVQAGSVIKPLQGRGRVNGEVTVTRPVLSSNKGVVLSQGLHPSYSDIDPYHMAACSIDTSIRNAVAAGADPDRLALLDNFCWCSPQDPQKLGELKESVRACYDCAIDFATPFISGKDSMFNDFKGYDEKGNPIKVSIPPTLLISSIGVVDDVLKTVSIDLKFPGDLIYILGETNDELGGSEYYSQQEKIGSGVPKVNAKKNKKLYVDYYTCIVNELISSAISINRGGLGVALAKTAMSGMLGLDISVKNLPGKVARDDFALFSESQGRILVSINPVKKKEFEKAMQGNPFALIGKVRENSLFTIKGKRENGIVNTDVNTLEKAYKSTFKNY
ncbi:phosphoribosylformylglycinamidine synthase [Candidatus Roizmanbacteria bacterium RIFCSPHIGHO2_02_FULL_39_9]|uniref:Phosphoribosylformylglycinamidine synthase subunit PurL n=1 Tax=Candidatus Roizmanbacteria bacterium RIFCSPHIGHO2_02_FULL_39_9 TaxID=1802040 RepID=A0A1F7H5I5_9BACT|nr:MAG: phosphoribosylformylglycinamidine synthase [Candidatus Roizmanbacteria bacterium RIFCSPHIGHO2_02_FULL_39_9]